MAKELWEYRRGPGQPPRFDLPETMWEQAVKYFEWCGEKLLFEDKAFHYQGEINHDFIVHKRPMTLAGLCIFLGINDQTYRNYRAKEEFFGVTNMIDEVMYEQKFSGASVGLYNANIIARDLGLADKTDITTNGKDINNVDLNDEKLADKLEKLGVKLDG